MKLAAIVNRVNAQIPSSVTPATRISIHPSDWIMLTDEIERLTEAVRKLRHFATLMAGSTDFWTAKGAREVLSMTGDVRREPDPRGPSA